MQALAGATSEGWVLVTCPSRWSLYLSLALCVDQSQHHFNRGTVIATYYQKTFIWACIYHYVYSRFTENALLISLSSYQLVHWSLSPSLLEDHPLILSLPGPPVHPCPSLSIYSCLFSTPCKLVHVFLANLCLYFLPILDFFQSIFFCLSISSNSCINCISWFFRQSNNVLNFPFNPVSLFAWFRCQASLHL